MATRRRGLFGRLFNQQLYLRDSRHAANNFGLNKSALNLGTPRLKFQFFVNIRFNTDPLVVNFVRSFLDTEDQAFVTALLKNITLPSANINTEVLNQYNKRRIVQTKVNFNPVTMTFHDTVDGKTLRFWEMYYEYYFKEGIATTKLQRDTPIRGGVNVEKVTSQFIDDTIKNNFTDNAGYNLERVGNSKQLISSIEIFQVNGGKFNKIIVVNPKITAFNHDTLDYSAMNETTEFNVVLEYENVLYASVNEQLTERELERYYDGDFWEMANLITIRTDVRGRNIRNTPQLPQFDGCGEQTNTLVSDSPTSALLGRFSEPLSNIAGRRNVARVEDNIAGIVDSIPNAVATAASASVFGGKISFQPNPIKAVKTSVNQLSRATAAGVRRQFTATVARGVSSVITGVQTGSQDDSETPPGDDENGS